MGGGELEGNLPFIEVESCMFQVEQNTGGSGLTGHRPYGVMFSWETDGKGRWGPVMKRQIG